MPTFPLENSCDPLFIFTLSIIGIFLLILGLTKKLGVFTFLSGLIWLDFVFTFIENYLILGLLFIGLFIMSMYMAFWGDNV